MGPGRGRWGGGDHTYHLGERVGDGQGPRGAGAGVHAFFFLSPPCPQADRAGEVGGTGRGQGVESHVALNTGAVPSGVAGPPLSRGAGAFFSFLVQEPGLARQHVPGPARPRETSVKVASWHSGRTRLSWSVPAHYPSSEWSPWTGPATRGWAGGGMPLLPQGSWGLVHTSLSPALLQSSQSLWPGPCSWPGVDRHTDGRVHFPDCSTSLQAATEAW